MFAAYLLFLADTSVELLAYGVLARVHATPNISLAAGLGLSQLTSTVPGPARVRFERDAPGKVTHLRMIEYPGVEYSAIRQ